MTQPNLKPWCYWMIECCDYEGFACMAHSAEGRVFECTFSKEGPWCDRGKGWDGRDYQKPIHPEGGGVCEDYESMEEAVAKKLMENR